MNARVVWNGGATGMKGQVAWSFEGLGLSYVQPQKIGRQAGDSQRDPYATMVGVQCLGKASIKEWHMR
ncbi:hypothetical protein SLA2020_455910 [Shorea laevis]